MFISVLDDIVCNAIDDQSDKREVALLTLRELLQAGRRRKHVIFFPYLTDGQIEQLSKVLTNGELGILRFIQKIRVELNRLKSTLINSICVTFSIPSEQDDATIYINPMKMGKIELYEETHLIVENLLDADFYAEIVCNNFINKTHLLGCLKKISYYPTQGGGATISEVVRKEQELAQHVCLIIADSDKKHSGAEEGKTAGDIREAIKGFPKEEGAYGSLQNLYVLSNVCEIENLVPLKVLHTISDKKRKKFINTYEGKLSYYDMKLGLDYRILYDTATYHEYKKIFAGEDVWQQIEICRKSYRSRKKEFEDAVKDLPKLDGVWGTTLMRNLMCPANYKAKQALNMMKNIRVDTLTDEQKKEWEKIGKIVYSWCCCYTGLG